MDPSSEDLRKYIQHSRIFFFGQKALLGLLTLVALTAIAYYFPKFWVFRQETNKLKDAGLPRELYTLRESLDSLHIQSSRTPNFQWLHSNRLSELEASSIGWTSLDGIENAPNLQTLTLNLAQAKAVDHLSQIGGLKKLTTLTLFLTKSGIHNLNDLGKLSKLQALRLSLDNSDIDFSAIADLPLLQTLILDLPSAGGKNIQGISKLNKIVELSLNLNQSSITELPDLSTLTSLKTLTLRAERSNIRNFGSISALHSVKNINLDLQELNLNPKGSYNVILPDFSSLKNLECLSLDLTNNRLAKLPSGLSKLNNLKNLTLRLTGTSVQQMIDLNSFDKLENVTLDIDRSDSRFQLPFGTDTHYKYRGLESLKFDSQSFQTTDIDKLNRFTFIHKLDVDLTSILDGQLPSFAEIKGLQELTIHLYWSQLSSLPVLPSLTRLSLWIEENTVGPQMAPDISQLEGILARTSFTLPRAAAIILELHLGKSRITNLPHFGAFSQIDSLILDLNLSEIRNFAYLSELKRLTKLKLEVEDCQGIYRLPPKDVLTRLTELTLNARSSSLANLDDLTQASHMEKLHLDLGDSKFTKLPDLTSLTGVTEFTANFNGQSTLALKETQKLYGIKEMTVSTSLSTLSDLPLSVVRLNLGELKSEELLSDKNQDICH